MERKREGQRIGDEEIGTEDWSESEREGGLERERENIESPRRERET